MSRSALILCVVHVALWGSFCAARLLIPRRRTTHFAVPRASRGYTAAYSRTLLVFHGGGIAVFYFGITEALLIRSEPPWAPSRGVVAVFLIALGSILIGWAAASLHSWRFRAKLDEGHLLTTTGAFRYLRHPIYSGMNLAALGTFLWVPTSVVWIGVMLIVIGSELRARVEESLLASAYGAAYAEYSQHTKRFIPYIY